MLDTDILSEIIKGVDQKVLVNARNYLALYPHLTVTSLSVYEFLFGLHAKNAPAQIRSFRRTIGQHDEIIPELEDYRMAAEIGGALK